jgi:hypothetical protein
VVLVERSGFKTLVNWLCWLLAPPVQSKPKDVSQSLCRKKNVTTTHTQQQRPHALSACARLKTPPFGSFIVNKRNIVNSMMESPQLSVLRFKHIKQPEYVPDDGRLVLFIFSFCPITN